MAILVTGCAGFIGMHVTRALLERGETVVGIDDCNAYYDPRLKKARLEVLCSTSGNFRFFKLDFADAAALEAAVESTTIYHIVHLGAQAGVRYSIEAPASYIRSNLVGHANILELARSRSVAHLVYASSSSVYGGGSTLPMSVDQRADRPLSLYAATKRSDELLSESYAHLFGVAQTGLRFFTVYGPWGRPDMALWIFTGAILSGQAIQLFNRGKMRRDFTYVDDVVRCIIALIDAPPKNDGLTKAGGSTSPHAIYNVGTSCSEELRRLVELLEESTGRTALLEFLPMQPGDMLDTFADIGAIQHDHGYTPSTSLDVGVPEFVDWFKRYHKTL